MATDLKGLNNFRKKLERRRNFYSNFDTTFVNEIAKRGEQIAQEEYGGVNKVNVSHEIVGANMARVVAQREGLAYIEFGTGDVGKQSNYPQANLPKQDVPITGDWKYYYEPSESKAIVNGERGWWWGKSFIKGRPAGMQMYHTSQRLKREISSIIKKKIKGDGKGV